MTKPAPSPSCRTIPLLLALIVGVGAALRFIPIWFGLPLAEARPDEETAIGIASAVLGGDPNPHFFHWPSLTFYLFAGCFRIALAVQSLIGLPAELSPNERYLIGRAVVAAAGTLTLLVLFALARKIADPPTGLTASAFLALAILHVRESHFAMTDVLMTLAATASIGLLLYALEASQARDCRPGHVTVWFAAAGVAGGLATSLKYSAASGVVAAAVAADLWLAWRPRSSPWRRQVWVPMLAFGLMCAAGFVATTPYALLDYPAFSTGLAFDVSHLAAGHGADLGVGWIYHLTHSLPAGLGLPIFVAALLGVVPLLRWHRRGALVVGAYSAALYLALGNGRTVFFRYILPIVPMACLSAAVAVRHAGGWLAARTRTSEGWVITALAVTFALPAAVNCIRFDQLLAKTDTRLLAGGWLAAHVKPEESLYDASGIYAGVDLNGVAFHTWSLPSFDARTGTFLEAHGDLPDWIVLPESPLTTYTSVPDNLRRLTARQYRLVMTFPATRGAPTGAIYDLQDAFFLPVAGFSTILRPGPTLLIYNRVSTSGLNRP